VLLEEAFVLLELAYVLLERANMQPRQSVISPPTLNGVTLGKYLHNQHRGPRYASQQRGSSS